MCDEVIGPSEQPVGLSTLLSRGPHSLSAAHRQPGVEPPSTCPPGEPLWGSARSSHKASIHFRPYFMARFRAFRKVCS
jgi:hypothetical protein